MASPYVVGRKVSLASGDIIVHISGNKLGTILIPIPPLSEQQRIVEKILEAEVKLTEYTGKENSLNMLQNTFPDALKKSILQWAAQGKLVPQDPADEATSVLLEHIRDEKEQLIKAGKIKRDKHESVIFRGDNSHYEKRGSEEVCIDDELPFDIPEKFFDNTSLLMRWRNWNKHISQRFSIAHRVIFTDFLIRQIISC